MGGKSSHNERVTTAAACLNHPSREAIGVCVKCRAQICSECVTKVDGINHCVRCYAESAARGAAPRGHDDASPGGRAAASALGLLVLATLLTWVMLEAGLPG